jgi:hypothetical protein
LRAIKQDKNHHPSILKAHQQSSHGALSMTTPKTINKYLSSLTALSLAVMVSACGGGGDATPTSNETLTGVFIDSPVINVGYRTATQTGNTNSLGQYTYLDGETVTFFIGDLEFPPTPAASVITPLELADSTVVTNPVVVNIIRLLQTLDKDGNPDNGIQITEEAKGAATQVDFTLDEAAFESDQAVTTLISSAGQDTTVVSLVSTEEALQHFQQSLNSLAEDVTVTASVTVTTTAYSQGALHEVDGATMQCDMGENKKIGDTETIEEVWTRSGEAITVYESGYPEEQWTMPINLSTLTIDFSDSFTDIDPTGEQDDIYTSTTVSTGSAVWNEETQAFVGTYREITTLSWTLNNSTSVCDQTDSVSARIIAGSAEEFIGSN